MGKRMFETVSDMKLVSVASLVSWKDDTADSTEGKKKILFQVGGFIGDLQMAEIAAEDEYSDDESDQDSMDDDFPGGNRNYDY